MAMAELMEEHKQRSSSTSRHLRYDIFLSFRGEDTRDTFTAYLYRELRQKQYDVFRDEEGIQCGDKIAPTLEKAIRESRLSTVVLSKDYASSTSCLNELETITECYREGWHHVVPVFYHVDPHQVRHQEGRFAVSFHQHEKDEKKKKKVGPWKAALRDIADLKGIHVEKGKRKEPDIIQEIIQVIGEIIGLKRKENPIPTSDLVGQGFEIAKAKILSWLNKDEVIKIGVYGMGGVGKTSLMTNVYNQVRESFTMRWITVSQDFSINKLQNLIADSVELDVSKEKDVKTRAAKLYAELREKRDLVLILDDLWNCFDEKEVGIPLWPKGCKLIFTTRALDICNWMNCQEHIIKMDPLDTEEAWLLFRKEIVNYNQNVEEVAKLIANECAGLPLAIRTMARYMRGVHDPCEWRNTLVELRESEIRNNDMEPDVFRILRFSYDRLEDSSLQRCFLYGSLFPEDFEIPREHLIKLLIAEGIIEPKSYIRDQVNKGHTMLNKLENLCLLESCKGYANQYGDVGEDKECVKMHDLIRDMALQILRKGSPVMVKAGMQLEELPDVDEWEEEDLVTVSLMGNNIREINSGQSPMCPKLSTLLLCYNPLSWSIDDSFFQHFCRLKVLDLSRAFIEILPSSISNLVRLTALLLRKCQRLKHVPSLAKLQELKMLDLSYACIEQVPHGMELLLKLRYIDMNSCSKMKVFPLGILPNLSHLQFCRLYRYSVVKGEEVGGLRRLQYLECCFQDLNNYVQSQNHLELDNFIITVLPQGIPESYIRHFPCQKSPNMFILYCCDIGRELKLPKGTVKLIVHGCKCQSSLFPLQNTNGLRCIQIIHCHGFACLVSTLSESCVHLLTGLERLTLEDNPSLQVLIRMEEDEVPAVLPLSYANVFAHLKNIKVDGCHRMEKLFPQGLLSNLKSLQTISVDNCYRMEEIIASEEREETWRHENLNNISKRLKSESSLPRLTSLQLRILPRLKNICSSLLICESLEEIVVSGCPMLKRIPVAPPLPSFGKMEIPSYELDWWKQLEWDYPDVKTVLSSCLSITKTRPQSAEWEDASGSETESSESVSSKLYAI